MAWGMLLATFSFVHVVLSLVGIGAGFVVLSGLLSGRERTGWTAVFPVTTVATSVTGFGCPVDHLLPSHVVGVVSLVVLTVAILAHYGRRLRGAWRPIYVICAAVALYLTVFVGVVQALLKVSALHALAPRQTEPPLLLAQPVVLALFIVLAVLATRRFRREPIARLWSGHHGRRTSQHTTQCPGAHPPTRDLPRS